MTLILPCLIVVYMVVSPCLASTAAVYSGADQMCNGLEVEPKIRTPYDTSWHMFQGRGCYNDTTNRALTGQHTELPYMTWELCHMFCRSRSAQYIYFGVKSGKFCRCGVRGATYTAQGHGACKTPCVGFHGKTCGGPGTIQVFEMFEGSNM